jgi:hypothetical protein
MTEQQQKIRDITAFVGDILKKLQERKQSDAVLCIDCSSHPVSVVEVVKKMLIERSYVVMTTAMRENCIERMYISDKNKRQKDALKSV